MRFLLPLLLCFQFAWSYTDSSLEDLWSSLSDLSNPTLEDYRLIESYLRDGQRPYLTDFYRTSFSYGIDKDALDRQIERIRNFKLVGSNGEMPIFQLHKLSVTEKTKDRCILIYASYNQSYPKKALGILDELKTCGYSGNVMIRIGGFPNLSDGGIKFSPFWGVWKNEFFKEALSMGFTKLLHLDTSIHPVNNLDSVFETMESMGYYLLSSGLNSQYLVHHQHLEYLRIPRTQKTPWLPGYIIGLNFSNKRAVKLFSDWDFATKDFDYFNYFGSEEVLMSILAWKHHLTPLVYYDHVTHLGYDEHVSKQRLLDFANSKFDFVFDYIRK